MWIGYWVFQIGKYLGYVIKAWGFISPMFGIFKSKTLILWAIVAILVFGSIGYGYWQHKNYVSAKETIQEQKSKITDQEKLIEKIKKDIEDKNKIVNELKEENKKYLDKLDILDSNIQKLISKIVNGNQSDKEEAKKEISQSIMNSYNCIMKASGVEDVKCKD